MEKPEHKNDCYAHECEPYVMLMKFQWKVKGTCKNKFTGGGGSYRATHASMYLEIHCNKSGRNSIKERLLEKSAKRIKHEEDVSIKDDHFQEELGASPM